ncbi:Na(+)/H(+) antiporter subunit D [Thalassomonas viridans]|uniref:Na(+)/H(+) antiporter subunit D n=1 Tax=Thalassomonas viridans TaxID=137584 RepID=A0AAE9ZA64_9GAMM|nr:Na(+)/H(+) antiporter subunit D [Thalassomonas viridans]WDE09037.1 Na(+)/H(+) antiporter subunit D [Thalassomonas viridans]
MWLPDLPPFVPFLIIALLVFFSRGPLVTALMLVAPVWGALNLWQLDPGLTWQMTLVELPLMPLRVDQLSLFFGYLFHLAAFFCIIYALHVRDKVQQLACLLYSAAALGAVFAGDLLSLFIFWEMMALSSVFLIWARRSHDAFSCGLRYLVFQVISGLLLLTGALFYWHSHGSLTFSQMPLQGAAGWLIFLAFGIKCAFPMLHSWLTDAYPGATVTGTVFLSAFTTKVAVYALARSFAGTELLVYIGAVMTCFPIFYAVIENDLRRVLAYSLINQLGFMVVGIGIGTELAINGAVAHAFNDVLFKGLLFMSMGAVLHMTGRINGSELGGLYKTMPKTTWLCLIGAASISAFPLFSGFVSKSMVMTAVLNQGYDWVWLALLFASAGVFHHAGIKIPYFAFFAHDSGIRTQDPPGNMLLAMVIAATLCLAIGIYPNLLYQLLPFTSNYQPYDVSHVLAQTQLLCFAALAFLWLNVKGIYPPELASVNLDADWLYRRLLANLWTNFINKVWQLDLALRQGFLDKLKQVLALVEKYHRPNGILARGQTVGNMTLWIAILLACSLGLSFISN